MNPELKPIWPVVALLSWVQGAAKLDWVTVCGIMSENEREDAKQMRYARGFLQRYLEGDL